MPARKYYPRFEYHGSHGKLIYLERIEKSKIHYAKWQCYCGKVFETQVQSIINNLTTSCGCWNKFVIQQKITDPNIRYLQNLYNNIKQRCYNINHSSYKNYGGRGISMSQEWINNKNKFIEDILNNLNHRTTSKHQLDRINNNGNYEISNLRWLLPKENSRNKTDNNLITINRETKTLAEWSEISKLHQNTIIKRIKNNYPEHEWLKPVKNKLIKPFDGTNLRSLHNGIITRCYNSNSEIYLRYGGRGIIIYEPWKNNYTQFQQDILNLIGPKPDKNYQLDRINNNGNYEPGNIRWVTAKENCNNRNTNKLIKINGEIKTLGEWATFAKIGKSTIRQRLLLGHDGEDLIKPIFKKKFNKQEIETIKNLNKQGYSLHDLAKQFNCGHLIIIDILHNRGAYKQEEIGNK